MNNDNYRPSQAQINDIYECDRCGQSLELNSGYSPGRCSCGGTYTQVGESYPADSSEWGEQRDPDGEWRERRW